MPESRPAFSRFTRAVILLGLLVLLFFAGPLVALYVAGFYGNTVARLQHDHSVDPPASVAHIRCGELFSTTFVDSTATVSFDLNRADLEKLLFQITWNDPLARDPAREMRGTSKDGNVVALEVIELEKPRVRVNLTTYWN